MPGKRGIHIVEQPVHGHESLTVAALLGRAAVVADRALQAVLVHVLLGGRRGGQGAHAQQLMAAAVARRPFVNGISFQLVSLLAQAGQCVIFTQISDNWLPLAVLGDKTRGQAGYTFGNPEALLFQ